MKNNFWIEEISPKVAFEEFIKTENPNATFWDIFSSYEPNYESFQPADNNPEWLQKQNEIINQIINTHFNQKALNQTQIHTITDTIYEYLLAEEDRLEEHIASKYKTIAEKIVEKHTQLLQLNQTTTNAFIDALIKALEQLNKHHIEESNKEAIRQNFRLKAITGEYTKEQVEDILKNMEQMWANTTDDELGESYDEFEEKQPVEGRDYFHYPQFPLAFSNTFYGFNDDAGNLSYKEQDQLVEEKFNQYKNEISELLNLQPNANLNPKDFNRKSDSAWDAYFELLT